MSIPFTHLHLHTEYSLLDGLTKISDAVKKVLEDGCDSLAITDHGLMAGIVDFDKTCRANKVKPIIGVELYTTDNIQNKTKESPTHHIVLLAKDQQGLKNLYKLSSIAYLDGFYNKPRIDDNLLAKYSEGLFCLSACIKGKIPSQILATAGGDLTTALSSINHYRDLFGDRFFLEVQPNQLQEQLLVNEYLRYLSKQCNIPTVATCDAHYAYRTDASLHSYLWRIGIKDSSGQVWPDEFWMRTPTEMLAAGMLPSELEMSRAIASQCNADLFYMSHSDSMVKYVSTDDSTALLYALVYDGLTTYLACRPNNPRVYFERVSYELSIIEQAGFCDYFLIVWDYVKYARDNGLFVGPGRGSAAGSLVSFLLGITKLDPIEYNIMFERFLTPGRVMMPDIDIDFTEKGRAVILQYLLDKYGKDRVSLIGTIAQLGAKEAMQDTGRILGIEPKERDLATALIPYDKTLTNSALISIDTACAMQPALAQLRQSPHIEQWFSVADQLIGTRRHMSSHASGIVISPVPLVEVLPLKRESGKDSGSLPINYSTQLDMKGVEALGLLKFDFLKLNTLDVVSDTLTALSLSMEEIPINDPDTYQTLGEGHTIGVFQLASRTMSNLCRQVKPSSITDLATIVALGRPSILNADQDKEYIRRKKGLSQVEYLHSSLESILYNTYGIILYQDQALKIAVQCAGYSYLEADNLRKILGKKEKHLIIEEEDKFVSGCMATTGMSREVAKQVFDLVAYFAAYGFNHSHAICYAYMSYITAYLKTHYPANFLAAAIHYASLSSLKRSERLKELFSEAFRCAVSLLPPNINLSKTHFTVEEKAIRYGLGAIMGLSEDTAKLLETTAPFTSLEDIINKIPRKKVNKTKLAALINSGALDDFGDRDEMLSKLSSLFAPSKKKAMEFSSLAVVYRTPQELLKDQLKICLISFPPEPMQSYVKWSYVYSGDECVIYGIVADVVHNLPMRCFGGQYSRFKLYTSDGLVPCLVFDNDLDDSLIVQGTLLLVTGRRSDKYEPSCIVYGVSYPTFKRGAFASE